MSRVFKIDYIADPARGRPLWNAKIYVGIPNEDPTIPSNQIQLTGDIGFPVGQSIPVPQPVRTNKGGVTVYNNSPLDLNAPGQQYAIAIYDRNDNLIYNFPQVDGSVAMNTTSQEEVTGLTIWPEVGEAVIGQTIPAGTDAIRYPFNGRSTLFTLDPAVAVSGPITDITINTSGIGTLTVDGSDVYELQEFNSFIAANDGDSQLAGGAIWPLSSQDSLSLGAQSSSVPSGIDRLRVSTGNGANGVEILYLWEPSGDFPASSQTVTNIVDNNLGGYDVTTNIQTYEFTTEEVRAWRGVGQNSLRLSVDARGWGYKGDGVSDDAPSVRAAGEYIDGSGGSIELPVTENGGLFKSDDGVNGIAFIVPARSRLFSQATNLEDETQTGGLIIRKDGNFLAVRLGGFSSEIENITILGAPGNGGGGIQLYGNNCVISRCSSLLNGTYGVKLGSETEARNCNNWKLDQVISRANLGDGFDIRGFDPGGGPDLNNGVAIKCQAFNNGNDGFVFEQTFVSTYIQCYAEGNGRFGYNLGTACSNNTFLNPGSEGNDSGDPDSQFAVGADAFNNILIGSFLYDPFDPNNILTVIRSTGGSNAYCKLSDKLAIGGGFPTNNAANSGVTVSGTIPGVILGDTDGPADQNNIAMYHNSGRTFFRYFEGDGTPHDWFNSTRNVDNTVRRTNFEGQLVGADGLGVGNSAAATTPGSIVARTQVYDESGNILGFIAIYDNIT